MHKCSFFLQKASICLLSTRTRGSRFVRDIGRDVQIELSCWNRTRNRLINFCSISSSSELSGGAQIQDTSVGASDSVLDFKSSVNDGETDDQSVFDNKDELGPGDGAYLASGSCHDIGEIRSPTPSWTPVNSRLVFLQNVISTKNATYAKYHIRSPHRIKELYLSSKHHGLLSGFSPEDFSALLALFGSISVLHSSCQTSSPTNSATRTQDHDGGATSMAIHPLAFMLRSLRNQAPIPSIERNHWAFVLSVARDKRDLGHKLSASDYYWLMRAALADVQRELAVGADSRNYKALFEHLDRARMYYLLIHPLRDAWDAHEAYFRTLLHLSIFFTKASLPISASLTAQRLNKRHLVPRDELAIRFADLIRWNVGIPSRSGLRELLWRVIELLDCAIEGDELDGVAERKAMQELTRDARVRIVESLRWKLERERQRATSGSYDICLDAVGTPDHEDAVRTGEEVMTSRSESHYRSGRRRHDAWSVRNLVTNSLLSQVPPQGRFPRSTDEADWAHALACVALNVTSTHTSPVRPKGAEADTSTAWNALRLLGLSYRAPAEMKSPDEAIVNGQKSETQMEAGSSSPPTWTVICALAALEGIVPSRIEISETEDSATGDGSPSSPFAAATQEMARELWVCWRREVEGHANRSLEYHRLSFYSDHPLSPPSTIRASILASFTRLALCTRDERLLKALIVHLQRMPFRFSDLNEAVTEAVTNLAVQLAIGTLVLDTGMGHPFHDSYVELNWKDDGLERWRAVWETLQSTMLNLDAHLRAEGDRQEWANAIANDVVSGLSKANGLESVLSALRMYASASSTLSRSPTDTKSGGPGVFNSALPVNFEFSGETISDLGIRSARLGYIHGAMQCLKGIMVNLRPESESGRDTVHAKRLMTEILAHIIRSDLPKAGLAPVVRTLAHALNNDALLHQGMSPRQNRSVKRLLEICIQEDWINEARLVLRAISRSSQEGSVSVLTRRLVRRLVRKMLARRRYNALAKLATTQGGERILRDPRLEFIRMLLAQTSASGIAGQIFDPKSQVEGSKGQKLRDRLHTRRRIARTLAFSAFDWPVVRRIARIYPGTVHKGPRIMSLKFSYALRRTRSDQKDAPGVLSTSDRNVGQRLDDKALNRALFLLLRVGRISSAISVLNTHYPIINSDSDDPKERISTKAGNILLSAYLYVPTGRARKLKQSNLNENNGQDTRACSTTMNSGRTKGLGTQSLRQVRRALRMLRYLMHERGFVPDRVTLNLLMRVLLRWRRVTPRQTLRVLFDRIVAAGYPFPSMTFEGYPLTHGPGRGPFGTFDPSEQPRFANVNGDKALDPRSRLAARLYVLALAASPNADGKTVPSMVFTRHVRPLYRMFIHAFTARGDGRAARMVSVALKKLQSDARGEEERREEARMRGRIKAEARRGD